MQSLIGTWWRWQNAQLDSALFYKRRAQRLAPWDRQIALNMVELVECTLDNNATIAEAERAFDIDPNAPSALESYAWALAEVGRWDDATAAYRRIYPELASSGVTASADRLKGEARFRATVRALRNAQYREMRLQPPAVQPTISDRIGLFEDLGMRDSSLAALSSDIDSVDAHRAFTLCGPNLRSFRADPRTIAIVRARGWPLGEFAPAR